MRLAVRTRAPRGDTGASAVEFALLMPIFIMLTFGTLTGGIAFWHHIELTQGARDAARLGATFPISTLTPAPTGEKTITDWLNMVADVAANESGWGGVADVDAPNSGGFICVAYVAGEGDSLVTARTTVGTSRASDGLAASEDDGCYADGLTDSRVQVLVRRDSELNAVLYSSDLELRSRSSIPYERRDPL
jgi:Flp pilus assembly protein TadG